MRVTSLCLALCIVLATSALCHALDLGCGVNYFDGWCKAGGDSAPEKEKKVEQQAYEWMPKDTPPVVSKMFQDPTPENVQEYRDWFTKRHDRAQEIGAMIRGGSGQNGQITDTQKVSFVKAIYFFREDCPHCAKMTPMLAKVQGSGKLVAVGVSSTDAGAAGYLERHGVNVPSAGDTDGSVAKNYKIESVPTIVFLDDKGAIVKHIDGEQTSETLASLFGG